MLCISDFVKFWGLFLQLIFRVFSPLFRSSFADSAARFRNRVLAFWQGTVPGNGAGVKAKKEGVPTGHPLYHSLACLLLVEQPVGLKLCLHLFEGLQLRFLLPLGCRSREPLAEGI